MAPTDEAPASDPPATEDPVWAARRLIRAARVGTLATSAEGQPFASLVTPACAPDLSLLLLLSTLSEHTRHLAADPRCSILVAGAAKGRNPQTTPRVTLTGVAERDGDPALKARYLALHPYAALYADFTDFAIWRVKPIAALFVGGFGRAGRLSPSALLPRPDAVEAILAAESGIIAHCNGDHPDAMAAIAGQPGDWCMVTVDVDGFDLACGDLVLRSAWSAPVREPAAVRTQLKRLTETARQHRQAPDGP